MVLSDLQLLLQQLGSLRAVAAVAVDVDGAGRRRVVDEEDRGDHVVVGGVALHRAGDRVVGDEVLHIFLGGGRWRQVIVKVIMIRRSVLMARSSDCDDECQLWLPR